MDTRRSFQRSLFLLLLACSTTLVCATIAGGNWAARVPEKERSRQNPLAGDANAVAAGAKLFRQNCAPCHAEQSSGRAPKRVLRAERIRAASPGELQWLLTNGSMKNGMPSWSRLPEQQRWQIVSYLSTF